MNKLVSLFCGIIFGIGLVISQMINPEKVEGCDYVSDSGTESSFDFFGVQSTTKDEYLSRFTREEFVRDHFSQLAYDEEPEDTDFFPDAFAGVFEYPAPSERLFDEPNVSSCRL